MMEHAGLASRTGLEEYPPAWVKEYHQFAATLETLSRRFGSRIYIHVFDPRSLQGFWKSIRFRVRTYPTFIINGRTKVTGWNLRELYEILEALTGTTP